MWQRPVNIKYNLSSHLKQWETKNKYLSGKNTQHVSLKTPSQKTPSKQIYKIIFLKDHGYITGSNKIQVNLIA